MARLTYSLTVLAGLFCHVLSQGTNNFRILAPAFQPPAPWNMHRFPQQQPNRFTGFQQQQQPRQPPTKQGFQPPQNQHPQQQQQQHQQPKIHAPTQPSRPKGPASTKAAVPTAGPPPPAAGAMGGLQAPRMPSMVMQFMGMSLHDICAALTLKGTGAQSDALDTIVKNRFPNASIVSGFRNRSNPMEYKQMFGSGPWACAFNFYADRSPMEVAGAFSDLVDGAGCNIACDPLRGPRKIGMMGMFAAMNGGVNPMGPMANPLAALGNMMGGMGNPMGGMGNPMGGMGGMGNPMGGMGNPMGGMGNPMGGMGNPMNGMGNPMNGMGNPMGGMGNPNNGMGNPNNGMGNPNNGMGNPNKAGNNMQNVMGSIVNLLQNPVGGQKPSGMGNGRPQGNGPNGGHLYVPPSPQPPRGNRWGSPASPPARAPMPFPDPSTQNAAPWGKDPFQITPPQHQPQQPQQHQSQQPQPQPPSQPQPTQLPFNQQISQMPTQHNHFPNQPQNQGPSPYPQPPNPQPQPQPPQQQHPQQPSQKQGLRANMANMPQSQDPEIAPHLAEALLRMPAPQRTQFVNDAISAFFRTLGIQLPNPQQQPMAQRGW
ncbi:heavy metal-associated isoprenylated plant protein 33-like isoform X5 [Haliotis rufescens]|uniref:heavy metal-associated isoprenylated plant protein 33-like isoform X5 n=1 Tax=Haliotis rufescens TaxID=6454 RepID=UPI00201F919F|nr:heavy metal-associated isoprenylated plant protein 33-like isoform X5 [Haliotis rufescens]